MRTFMFLSVLAMSAAVTASAQLSPPAQASITVAG